MDWSKLVTDLESTGLSLTAIAGDVGLSVAALSDIKQGRSKCPRGMAAVLLHKLHTEKCLQPPITADTTQAAQAA